MLTAAAVAVVRALALALDAARLEVRAEALADVVDDASTAVEVVTDCVALSEAAAVVVDLAAAADTPVEAANEVDVALAVPLA